MARNRPDVRFASSFPCIFKTFSALHNRHLNHSLDNLKNNKLLNYILTG